MKKETQEMLRNRLSPIKYPVVPIKVLSANNLTSAQKVLYAGIVSLTGGNTCYATNERLMGATGLSEASISSGLVKLDELKVIRVEFIDNFRAIRLTSLRESRLKVPVPKRTWEGRDMELQRMLHDPKDHIQIIALFVKHKEIPMENFQQRDNLIKRYSRVARQLSAYETKQIVSSMKKYDEKFPEYTLETILKDLTK